MTARKAGGRPRKPRKPSADKTITAANLELKALRREVRRLGLRIRAGDRRELAAKETIASRDQALRDATAAANDLRGERDVAKASADALAADRDGAVKERDTARGMLADVAERERVALVDLAMVMRERDEWSRIAVVRREQCTEAEGTLAAARQQLLEVTKERDDWREATQRRNLQLARTQGERNVLYAAAEEVCRLSDMNAGPHNPPTATPARKALKTIAEMQTAAAAPGQEASWVSPLEAIANDLRDGTFVGVRPPPCAVCGAEPPLKETHRGPCGRVCASAQGWPGQVHTVDCRYCAAGETSPFEPLTPEGAAVILGSLRAQASEEELGVPQPFTEALAQAEATGSATLVGPTSSIRITRIDEPDDSLGSGGGG